MLVIPIPFAALFHIGLAIDALFLLGLVVIGPMVLLCRVASTPHRSRMVGVSILAGSLVALVTLIGLDQRHRSAAGDGWRSDGRAAVERPIGQRIAAQPGAQQTVERH